MDENGMKNRTHGLSEREMELAKLLMADCKTTGDVQAMLKRLRKFTKSKLIFSTDDSIRKGIYLSIIIWIIEYT